MRTHAIWRRATCRIGPARSPQPPAFVRDEHFAPAQRGKRNRAGESFRDPGLRHRAAALPRKDSRASRRSRHPYGDGGVVSAAAPRAIPLPRKERPRPRRAAFCARPPTGTREPRRPAAAIPAPTRMRVSARPSRETCSPPDARLSIVYARGWSAYAPTIRLPSRLTPCSSGSATPPRDNPQAGGDPSTLPGLGAPLPAPGTVRSEGHDASGR